jgi:gas vesicle protein
MIKENISGTILAFLLGAAAGAAAALLFAPKAGEELRNDIAEAVNDPLITTALVSHAPRNAIPALMKDDRSISKPFACRL